MNKKNNYFNPDNFSNFEFSREMLEEDNSAAIKFDIIQHHPEKGYMIFSYIPCKTEKYITPYTSHPKRYWNYKKNELLNLWKIASDLKAVLYLVNYAKAGTEYADEVLLIEVQDMDDNGITKENQIKHTRSSFSKWFRQINAECLGKEHVDEIDSPSEEAVEEKALICPNCGMEVRNGKYGYYCTGKCGMDIGKLYGKNLDEGTIIKLLEGNEIEQDNIYILPKIEMYTFNDKKTNSAVTRYHWKTMKKDFFEE